MMSAEETFEAAQKKKQGLTKICQKTPRHCRSFLLHISEPQSSDLPSIPPFLAERVQVLGGEGIDFLNRTGTVKAAQDADLTDKRVIYCMQTALRGHENPALSVALLAAEQLEIPLEVHIPLLLCHPHATARRWTFFLQCVRDAVVELGEKNIPVFLHVEKSVNIRSEKDEGRPDRGWGWKVLSRLRRRAALLVTENMPVLPHGALPHLLLHRRERKKKRETDQVVENEERDADGDVNMGAGESPEGNERRPLPPVWVVDSHCVVPVGILALAPTTAKSFREVTKEAKAQRMKVLSSMFDSSGVDRQEKKLRKKFPNALAQPSSSDESGGGDWEAVETKEGQGVSFCSWEEIHAELGEESRLRALVESCSVDAGAPEVEGSQGGSVAGYARWSDFVKGGGLKNYASQRNQITRPNAVSRMSAYLHWGAVSPFRLAAQAGDAWKFGDELLTWRELAFHFCHKLFPLHGEFEEGIPDWAKTTLRDHDHERGGGAETSMGAMTLRILTAGETDEPVWNLAQSCLVRHGELHNHIRMRWGKLLVGWGPSAERSLQWALHLNHRFALDGCDPCSYSGVLGSFGLFESPKGPQKTPVFGKVQRKFMSYYTSDAVAQYKKVIKARRYGDVEGEVVRRRLKSSSVKQGKGKRGKQQKLIPLVCGIQGCIKTYVQKSSLTKHRKNVHGVMMKGGDQIGMQASSSSSSQPPPAAVSVSVASESETHRGSRADTLTGKATNKVIKTSPPKKQKQRQKGVIICGIDGCPRSYVQRRSLLTHQQKVHRVSVGLQVPPASSAVRVAQSPGKSKGDTKTKKHVRAKETDSISQN
uniref:C2H2-type domain-containing protein n=1 Tax=Chromera velia CCMP2878 TaxID=1169474 RepID=A0A0G4HQU5_9ALVE|eukprot:Cvel_1273.t1-p1 / transcript=Cvel_1273.t1 / gene=Cvel_1273 / organism=Chromera_velia_CCMP2878 / gene_product=Deoxyribodipyrimidine photo-lyase, putative / transcript_product=Deoxyribodipyrimidine photo-lyase, putative / location=Cvel_scaffold42:147943-155179(+) / protein_length=818 / sequence_SO=supercontig / SO=protein_coding / is_pseudo=false